MLTIFTPSYNRADKLSRLYESLGRQTCFDFEWLIIDDGSSDDTQTQVQIYLQEQRFAIRYIRKENGGKHTAHNLALEKAHGEWFLCVDSDDYLAESAVETLLRKLRSVDNASGVIAYKQDTAGNLLSGTFPSGLERERMYRLGIVHGCRGEFTLAFSTAFAKHFPFPVFPGERFVTECVVYDRMDQFAEMALLPEVITVCEYQPGGYSQNANKLMKQNPNSFCLYFLQRIDLQAKLLPRIVHAGKYWCFRWISGNCDLTYSGKYQLLVALAAIPGALFRVYYKLLRGI